MGCAEDGEKLPRRVQLWTENPPTPPIQYHPTLSSGSFLHGSRVLFPRTHCTLLKLAVSTED
jgi:hypothetical protein